MNLLGKTLQEIKMNNFFFKIKKRIAKIDSRLCVGIDPHKYLINGVLGETKKDKLIIWSKNLIDQTKKYAACFKINIAFFEMYGIKGLRALKVVIKYAKRFAPVILDAKRGDIDSTASAYAQSCFKKWKADSVTVSPYLGMESLNPFLQYKNSSIFLLCHTSNTGASEIQRNINEFGTPTYAWLALKSKDDKRIGLVVGATQSDIVSEVRKNSEDSWLLCPGVGSQGGSLRDTVINGWGKSGNILISVSRKISESKYPKKEAEKFRNKINKIRDEIIFPTKNHEMVALELIKQKCVLFGSFKLKSEVTSPIYIDLRKITGSPNLYNMITDIYKEYADKIKSDALLALPMSGLPIASSMALKMKKPLCYTRSAKKYGTGKSIEGGVVDGLRVLLIDDVTSKGTSAIESLDVVREKYLANDLLVLIDRDSGAEENLSHKKIKLHKIFSLKDLLLFWKNKKIISKKEYENSIKFILENNNEV